MSVQQSKPLETSEATPFVRHRFPNGLTLLIQEDHSHPLAAFHAVVPTGSATEGKFLGTGISHVVEHMLFKGTARRPVGAVEKEARLYGGTSQGFTTYDTTSYQLIVNKEHWSQGADLMVDALFFSTLDSDELLKERDVVLRELKMRKDDPSQVAWDLLFDNAYRVHPYRIPIIGYEPLLMKLTAEDVREYHRMHYVPNQMTIAVVGDVDPTEVIRRFGELVKEIPPGRVTQEPLPEEPPPLSPRQINEEADIQLGIVAIGVPSVAAGDPDLFALDLLAYLLGGERGSRLEKNLRDTGIVHAVSSWNYTPQQRGLFSVTMRLDPDRAAEAAAGVWKEFGQAASEPFPPEELEQAKRALLREYLSGRQTVGGEASDLAGYEVLVGDPAFAVRYLEGIRRLQPADLQRAAQRYLVKERATTVTLLPRTSVPGTDLQSSVPGTDVVSAERVRLENGVRVILRRDTRLPLITLQASMLGGVRYETDSTNGLSRMAADLLLRGTRHRTKDQIDDAVKQLGGDLNSFSGRNSLGLTFSVISSELPRAVPLFGEILSEPDFPAEELEKERRLALAGLKAQEEDPFSWGLRRLVSTLFTKHPYRLDPAGEAQALRGLKREDLIRFYGQALDPARLVIAVAGQFERDETLKLLKQAVGGIPASKLSVPEVPPEPPLTAPRERIEATPREEALVLIGFPGIKVSDPRAPALDLLEAVLSGGAGRLFTEVRERRGLAYTVGAFAMHGVDPGSFVLYAITDPANSDGVRAALLEEVRRLRQADVPPEELQEAKQGLLGGRRIARQTQQALAAQMAGDELYGLGFDYSAKYDERVQQLGAEDLRRAAQELLDPERCVVVIGRPAKK